MTTTNIRTDGHCENCGTPVTDGFNGIYDTTLGVAVCDTCVEAERDRVMAEVQLDRLHALQMADIMEDDLFPIDWQADEPPF